MAIKKGEDVVVGPGGNTKVEEGDVLVAIGHEDSLKKIADSLQW